MSHINLKGFKKISWYEHNANTPLPRKLTRRQQRTIKRIVEQDKKIKLVKFGEHLPQTLTCQCWDEKGKAYVFSWYLPIKTERYLGDNDEYLVYEGDDCLRYNIEEFEKLSCKSPFHPLNPFYEQGLISGSFSWDEIESGECDMPDPDPNWSDEQKEVFLEGQQIAYTNSCLDV
jgi:hypothetical protein